MFTDSQKHQKYRRLVQLTAILGDRFIYGKPDEVTHKAWLRAYYLKEYYRTLVFGSPEHVLLLKWCAYLQVSGE